MNTHYVYCLRRPDKKDPLNPEIGQIFYIGKGSSGRVNGHRVEAKRFLHKPGKKIIKITIIHKLWKQGLDFSEEILFGNLTKEQALKIECETISLYGRLNAATGYLANMTDGGEGGTGVIYTAEQRERRSKQLSGKGNPMYGRDFSKEHRQKLREAGLGRTHTEEEKQKISRANKGQVPWLKGKTLSEETKQKMRDAYQKRPNKWVKGMTAWNKGKSCPQISAGLKGHPTSDETKQKIGEAQRGKKHSAEHCQKIRESHLGHKHSEETKRKMGEASRGNKYGLGSKHPHTEETKRKISETKLRKREAELYDRCQGGLSHDD